jgi:hypothetical protein
MFAILTVSFLSLLQIENCKTLNMNWFILKKNQGFFSVDAVFSVSTRLRGQVRHG